MEFLSHFLVFNMTSARGCNSYTKGQAVPDRPQQLILFVTVIDDFRCGDTHFAPVHHELTCLLNRFSVRRQVLKVRQWEEVRKDQPGLHFDFFAEGSLKLWPHSPRQLLTLEEMESPYLSSCLQGILVDPR